MANLKQNVTNAISEVDTHSNILIAYRSSDAPASTSQKKFTNKRPYILQAPRKNQTLVKIWKRLSVLGSPTDNSNKNDHPARQLANCKQPNNYTFFGTVYIKTSATMLTVFYMLLLAVANFAVDIIAVEPSSFTYAGTVSTVILLAVVLAQYGMWKELSLCLLPIIIFQVLLALMMILIFAFSNFIEFQCFFIEVCPGGRFIMLITGSIIFCVFHCYCIVIMWRCWKYFRYMEKKAALERSWHAETTEDEIDEDILIFNAPSENSNQC